MMESQQHGETNRPPDRDTEDCTKIHKLNRVVSMTDNDDSAIMSRLSELAHDITDTRDVHRMLVSERDRLIVELYENGYSMTDIAKVAGVIYQQVQQIVKRNR